MTLPLIDTHSHFDEFVFDEDRLQLAQAAYQSGVRHILLIGYLEKFFDRMRRTQQQLEVSTDSQTKDNAKDKLPVPTAHLASGLHPAYIEQHTQDDLKKLAECIEAYPQIAVGEIGMDTYTPALKSPEAVAKQEAFFIAQLDLAVKHSLPVLLHIRKAHAETLKILKAHEYDAHKLGGIAHSFSGGEQEAKSFVKLGFKLGVTGQVTNPNAKKLRRAIIAAVDEYGMECLVLETDCPDMTPVSCQHGGTPTRNVPQNITFVLQTLSELLSLDKETLAKQCWQNSCAALQVDWPFMLVD